MTKSTTTSTERASRARARFARALRDTLEALAEAMDAEQISCPAQAILPAWARGDPDAVDELLLSAGYRQAEADYLAGRSDRSLLAVAVAMLRGLPSLRIEP